MVINEKYDAQFSGIIGQDYDMLKMICPLAVEMSHLVGETLKNLTLPSQSILKVVELGGGTGITTLSLLTALRSMTLLSIDNEPVMQNQAKSHLASWVESGQLTFELDDALSALQKLPDSSIDVVASAYTLHNFLQSYRAKVINEIFRVLKPNGLLINGDRYALDNVSEHTQATQEEIKHYFKILVADNKLDLLQQWIIHLFNDESENHIMRENVAISQLYDAGFIQVRLTARNGVNALVTATKPAT